MLGKMRNSNDYTTVCDHGLKQSWFVVSISRLPWRCFGEAQNCDKWLRNQIKSNASYSLCAAVRPWHCNQISEVVPAIVDTCMQTGEHVCTVNSMTALLNLQASHTFSPNFIQFSTSRAPSFRFPLSLSSFIHWSVVYCHLRFTKPWI